MAKTTRPIRPLDHRELQARKRITADGKATPVLAPLFDADLRGIGATQILQDQGRLRVFGEVAAAGLERARRPHDRVQAVRLKEKDLRAIARSADVHGFRPQGVATTFKPRPARPTHQLPVRRGKGLDRGGSIFGTDDRRLFDDTSFPWCTTGKVRTNGKWGSGTTIGPRHVLTASHVVDWAGADKNGVPWLTFTPSYFDGRGPWGDFSATTVIYWEQAPGSLTDEQTAFDYVVLVMADRVGEMVGYPGFRTYDSDWNDGKFWQYIGYPGELSSGERPAFQGACAISSVQDESLGGRTGNVLGHFNEFTPGQSGGSVWGWWKDEPWPRVVGVGSTIGDTAVKTPNGTDGDNEYGGGPALSDLIAWARSNFP